MKQKTGNSAFFCGKQQIPWQMANSAARRENPHAAEYCWPCSCAIKKLLTHLASSQSQSTMSTCFARKICRAASFTGVTLGSLPFHYELSILHLFCTQCLQGCFVYLLGSVTSPRAVSRPLKLMAVDFIGQVSANALITGWCGDYKPWWSDWCLHVTRFQFCAHEPLHIVVCL